jgi:hypothetical protein
MCSGRATTSQARCGRPNSARRHHGRSSECRLIQNISDPGAPASAGGGKIRIRRAEARSWRFRRRRAAITTRTSSSTTPATIRLTRSATKAHSAISRSTSHGSSRNLEIGPSGVLMRSCGRFVADARSQAGASATYEQVNRLSQERAQVATLTRERRWPKCMLDPDGRASARPSRMANDRRDAHIFTHTKARESPNLVIRGRGFFGDSLGSRPGTHCATSADAFRIGSG